MLHVGDSGSQTPRPKKEGRQVGVPATSERWYLPDGPKAATVTKEWWSQQTELTAAMGWEAPAPEPPPGAADGTQWAGGETQIAPRCWLVSTSVLSLMKHQWSFKEQTAWNIHKMLTKACPDASSSPSMQIPNQRNIWCQWGTCFNTILHSVAIKKRFLSSFALN